MDKCGVLLSNTQFEALYRHSDRDGSGKIEYREFERLFEGGDDRGRSRKKWDAGDKHLDPDDLFTEWEDQLEEALEKCFNAHWEMAADGNQSILERGDAETEVVIPMMRLAYGSLTPTKDEVTDVVESICGHGRKIEYYELKDGFLDWLIDHYRKRVEKALADKKPHHATLAELVAFFAGFDRDGDGCITFEEFMYVLVKKKALCTEHEARSLGLALDRDGDGTISWTEFEDFIMSGTAQRSREHGVQIALAKMAVAHIRETSLADIINSLTDGLPKGLRRPSYLAPLERLPAHSLKSVLRNALSSMSQPAAYQSLPVQDGAAGTTAGVADLEDLEDSGVSQVLVDVVKAENVPTPLETGDKSFKGRVINRNIRISMFDSRQSRADDRSGMKEHIVANTMKAMGKVTPPSASHGHVSNSSTEALHHEKRT